MSAVFPTDDELAYVSRAIEQAAAQLAPSTREGHTFEVVDHEGTKLLCTNCLGDHASFGPYTGPVTVTYTQYEHPHCLACATRKTNS